MIFLSHLHIIHFIFAVAFSSHSIGIFVCFALHVLSFLCCFGCARAHLAYTQRILNCNAFYFVGCIFFIPALYVFILLDIWLVGVAVVSFLILGNFLSELSTLINGTMIKSAWVRFTAPHFLHRVYCWGNGSITNVMEDKRNNEGNLAPVSVRQLSRLILFIKTVSIIAKMNVSSTQILYKMIRKKWPVRRSKY